MPASPSSKFALLTVYIALAIQFTGCDAKTAAPAAPAQQTQEPAQSEKAPKKIFGHYMGCFPVGRGAMNGAREDSSKMRHDSTELETAMGGRFKTWPLLPAGSQLTAEESADLEIRRAIRAGLSGFAIDAWAGDVGAQATLDALFAAAEAGKYPFEITVCLDPSCLPPGEEGYLSAIRYLLDKHGDSPNLARRNGKPLIFGYSSQGLAAQDLPEDSEEKWKAMGETYKKLEAAVGQPLYFHYGMEFFLNGVDFERLGLSQEKAMVKAAGALGKDFDAVGLFLDYQHLPFLKEMSKAVRASGAEWAPPMSIQYDNIMGSLHAPKGTAYLRDGWDRARRDEATLMQFATWNDYGEHTTLAPTVATGYGVGELNRYFAQWWKDGKPPETDHDQIYATYRKHAPDAKIFPFQTYRSPPGVLEILTVLPRPATIRLPGRTNDGQPIEYPAEAGLFVKRFPLTPGPVTVEVVRDGKTATKLEAPEPISDRPYREDNTLVCASTEDRKDWQEDFPDVPYPKEFEYADDDGDGLPNWFEMYWFGRLGDYSTATAADPAADPDGDGQMNLQEFLSQTDPTQKPAEYHPGFVWDLTDVYRSNRTFNPDRDSLGSPVWFYLSRSNTSETPAFAPMTDAWMRNLAHQGPTGTIDWREFDGKDDPEHPLMKFKARSTGVVALGWRSPVDGVVDVEWETAPTRTQDGLTFSVWNSAGGESLWSRVLKDGEQVTDQLKGIKVHAGERILFVQDPLPGGDAGESFAFSKLRITLQGGGK